MTDQGTKRRFSFKKVNTKVMLSEVTDFVCSPWEASLSLMIGKGGGGGSKRKGWGNWDCYVK